MNNCKKLFKVGKNLSKGVFSLILFTCGFVSAASVAPLYFENVGSSAMDNPETQQQYWESLMKYKLWGTNGIDVAEKVIIGDNVGYNGTASGDFVIRNFQHHFGGPTMVGGDFIFSSTTDTISMGPVRVLGNLQVNGKSNNVMEGDWCVQGNITQRYNDGSLNYWNEVLTGGIYNDATTLSKKKGSYEDCNEVIAPPVETEMTVPIWPEPDSWEGLEAISMTSSYANETYLIHVPPDSVETNEYGTYDKYITNFSIGGSTGKVLYVLMPPGGKLTRIYSQNGFNFSNSANDMKIIVAYVDEGVTFDRTTMKWDVAAPASKDPPYQNQPANGSSWEFTDIDKINILSNTDYAGNLLFYTTKDINWSYWKSASFQGSWISTGTITVGGHFKLAGQVIANNLKFQADVSGDFRYVPFDPPILNIDPTALASGKFLESDANQYVPIKLDAIPTTMVEFNYCFEAPDSTGEGIASFADFDKEKANMAICGIDTGHVVIPVGKLYPTDSLFVNAVLDGVVEDEESFKLHVFDMGGAVLPGNKRSGSFTLYIKDVDKNFPPVFNDTIFSVPENSKVNAVVGTLKAADVNKDDLTYTVLGGDSTIFRVDASGKVILKQEVLDFETRTDYELTVFVTDDLLNDTAIVKITVLDVNEKPVVKDSSFSIAENTLKGTSVGTLTFSDPDKLSPNNTLNFSILSGNGDGFFSISSTGELSVAKDGLDFETTESYTLKVLLSDAGSPVLSDTATVKISILDVNEKPVVKDSSFSIAENTLKGTSVGTLTFSDPDRLSPNNTLSFSILSGNGNGFFSISSTGELSVAKDGLDFETTESYTLKVLLSDAGSPILSDTATVKISILDINEKPVVKDSSFSIAENTLKGTSVGTLTFSDPDKLSPNNTLNFSILSGNGEGFFSISSTGELSVAKDGLDFETTESYTLKVLLSDAGSPVLSDTATVQISVLDLNEKPTVKDDAFSIAENTLKGASVGTLTFSDPDKLSPNNTLNFSILSGNGDGFFSISSTGELSVAKDGLDFETTASYTLTVLLTDAGSPSLKDTATVQITILDVNEKPIISDASYLVEENNKSGLLLGTLSVSEPDILAPNNTLSFEILSGNDGAYFAVSDDGKLTVARSGLDFESTESYTLTILVSDAGTPVLSDTATVQITVLDVNEKPTVKDDAFSIAEKTLKGTSVGTLTFSDPDKLSPNNTLSFSILSGNGEGFFSVSSTGKISVAKDGLDFEKVSSYTLTIQVSDAGSPSLKDTATVKITVLDVNEKPTVENAAFSVAENSNKGTSVGTLTFSDLDKLSPNNTLKFSILSGNGDGFFSVSSAGKISVAKTGLDFEKVSNYTLTIRIADAGSPSLSDTATIEISILNVNEKPVIADAEFTIPRSATAADLVGVLKATDVDAGDQALLSYAVITSGVPFEQKSSSADLIVKGTTPFVNVAKNIYLFEVVVTDKGGLKDTASVTVKVKNNAPEIVTEEIQIAENSRDSIKVEVSDADGDTKFSYSITDPNNKFVINPSTGVVSLKKDVSLNYESADSVLFIQVTVSDGLESTTKKIKVKVVDVNERPNIENQSFVVAENSLVNTEFGQVKASDPDSDKLTYSVIGGDSDFFTLNEKSGMLSVKKAELDYEKKKSYSLKVVVNDGKLKDTAVVTINISNILEQSIVNVMTVESGITRYEIKKDTAFINRTFANISWVLINKLGKNSYKDTSLQDLPDGCHTYRFADTDKTIDIRGRDSVTICVSTSVPEVVIKPLDKDSSKITGVTIVEGTSSKDSSFYVNEKDNDLVAIVKDPLTNSVDTLPLQVRLDSVVVPKKVLETATEIQKEFFPEPNDSTKKVTVENGKVAVEYTQKVNGTTVTVKYYETESGEKILDSEGREVVYVTYATVLNGDTVKISYPADALTGKPVQVVAGANSSNGSNVSGGSGESGSSSSSKPGTSSKPGSDNNSGNSSNGSGSNSSSGNGSGSSSGSSEDSSILDSFVGGVFEISYVYQDKKGNIVEVSYPVDKKGNILENENGDKSYEVTYSYVNSYGNSASHTVSIILDEVLPVVKILSPEHLSKHSSVSIEVVWTVDGVEQDTLTLQSLDVGTNIIIRTFRDKAGNEASDTVAITMKNAKNVVISMVEPVVKVDPEKAEELYAGNPPEEDERFAVSIFNPREEKEVTVLQGNSSNVEKADGEEPYPGHSGAHLGPTMKVELKMPSVNAFGGLATIDDMIESDGLVSLEAGGGWDREKITVDEYISDYCSEEFQQEVDKSNLAATPLYTVKYKMHVWIYTSLGNFVDDFSFSLDLTDGNLVNDAGVLELFFEMKPGVDGALRASTGRLLGTGAYLVKTEISSVAKLRCQLPDKKVGSKIIEKENDLTSFGYSRPVHLK